MYQVTLSVVIGEFDSCQNTIINNVQASEATRSKTKSQSHQNFWYNFFEKLARWQGMVKIWWCRDDMFHMYRILHQIQQGVTGSNNFKKSAVTDHEESHIQVCVI